MPEPHEPLLHPGVYVQELSTPRLIDEPPTAELGIVGWFARGPVGVPVRVGSRAEVDRVFGRDERGEAGWTVLQFFTNGGEVAHVMRVAPGALPASATLTDDTGQVGLLDVTAVDPGAWGDALRVTVEHDADDTAAFTLRVEEVATVPGGTEVIRSTEVFPGCTTASDGSGISAANAASALVRLSLSTGATGARPAEGATALTGGDDGEVPGSAAWLAGAVDALAGSPGVAGGAPAATGVHALGTVDGGAPPLLVVPDAIRLPAVAHASLLGRCSAFCREHRVFQLVDPPWSVTTAAEAVAWATAQPLDASAATHHPRLLVPLPDGSGADREVGPSGTIAGIVARTDATRGVWEAPAGTAAEVWGATVSQQLTQAELESLNLAGVNPIRALPNGTVVWGARTMAGRVGGSADGRYVPVRRTLLHLERTLERGLRWVVFEPNEQPLWQAVELAVGTVLHGLWLQGALQGSKPADAYRVRCGLGSTMTANDVADGRLVAEIHVALVQPAEFHVIRTVHTVAQG